MESLYNLSDEEKINIATKLLNSLKGTFKNTVNASKKGNSTSFLDLKGVLSKDIDGNKLYDEYIYIHDREIFDDISLAPGNIRIRRKGSDGGQNGVKNIIYLSGSDEFKRIKIGIGPKPNENYDLSNEKDFISSE